ncbi:hypothetical protein HMPREF1863_01100 [Aedoeadaptatus coxii]|uniref:Uncharacterized protein n=1 Tax=Aedoeadaptatus coxii TaxID=755172 RepID=A0A134AF36_9FIRM|nr:hypothetical protein HMPREF1863_01100 [Peptoniphilus coxii]
MRKQNLPAHAGVIPSTFFKVYRTLEPTRTRGGDPRTSAICRKMDGTYPHTRG